MGETSYEYTRIKAGKKYNLYEIKVNEEVEGYNVISVESEGQFLQKWGFEDKSSACAFWEEMEPF